MHNYITTPLKLWIWVTLYQWRRRERGFGEGSWHPPSWNSYQMTRIKWENGNANPIGNGKAVLANLGNEQEKIPIHRRECAEKRAKDERIKKHHEHFRTPPPIKKFLTNPLRYILHYMLHYHVLIECQKVLLAAYMKTLVVAGIHCHPMDA